MASASVRRLLQAASEHHRAGRFGQAEQAYRQILRDRPDEPDALHLLGTVLCQMGRAAEGMEPLRRAVAARPHEANFHANLGAAQRAVGQSAEAEQSLHRALQLQPQHIEALNNLGNVLQDQARYEESIECFRRATLLRPNLAQLHSNLGNSLLLSGKRDEAKAQIRRALELAPGDPHTMCSLGRVLMDEGRLSDAVSTFTAALTRDPQFGAAHELLGGCLLRQGRFDEALAQYRDGIRFAVNERAKSTAYSNLLLAMHYHPRLKHGEIAAEHRAWAATCAAPLAVEASRRRERNDAKRLRVGYVSPDFRGHVVAQFVEPVFQSHDRTRFEVFCYFTGRRADETTARLCSLVEHWRAVAALSDEALAGAIRADGIDILVDLAGHTADNRLLTFARGPAPVQITWLGYPNTTGLSSVDWRVTDDVADPPGMTESLHSERLLRLRGGFLCYQPHREAPAEVTQPPCLARGFVTFGCFNAHAKLNAQVILAWSAILDRIPGSKLFLKTADYADAPTRQGDLEAFASQGIAGDRLTLEVGTTSAAEHLAAYHRVDVALDPFPYNGTTTTCDALWMGVPVVTLAGAAHVGRVGASILTHLGLETCIARTEAEYVDRACAVAQDVDQLRRLRESMRACFAQRTLGDAQRFTRELESAFLTVWNEQMDNASTRPTG